MSHRRIANITAIRDNHNPCAKLPFVVERLTNMVEHITGGPRVLHTSTSYTITKVGYYAAYGDAILAANRSAEKHGGFVRLANGCLYPTFPYKGKS